MNDAGENVTEQINERTTTVRFLFRDVACDKMVSQSKIFTWASNLYVRFDFIIDSIAKNKKQHQVIMETFKLEVGDRSQRLPPLFLAGKKYTVLIYHSLH